MKHFVKRWACILLIPFGLMIVGGCEKSTQGNPGVSQHERRTHAQQLRADLESLYALERSLSEFGIELNSDYSVNKSSYFRFRLTHSTVSLEAQNIRISEYLNAGNVFLNAYTPGDVRNEGAYGEQVKSEITAKLNAVQQVANFSDWLRYLYDNRNQLVGWGTWTIQGILQLMGYLGLV